MSVSSADIWLEAATDSTNPSLEDQANQNAVLSVLVAKAAEHNSIEAQAARLDKNRDVFGGEDEAIIAQSTLHLRELEEEECFTDLVQAAGLDPARDLRGKALRCIVVQPDEDLTGHDFGGSDLTGAVFRRVDLSAVRLQDASLYAADLRGATLPKLGLCADQREQALTGALPPALRQGPNRLWPAHLIDAINEILTECGDDDELSFAARPRFREGSYGLAEHLFRTLLDWQNIVLEDDHERTLVTRHMLARAILDQGRYQEAEEMFRALLPVEERVLGSESKNTLVTRHALAQAILDQARAQEAEEMLRVLLPVEERVLGSENENTHVTRHNLAITILFQGRTREAEEMLRALLNLEENNVGAEKDSALVTRRNLALALLEQQATEEAAAILAKIASKMQNGRRGICAQQKRNLRT
eukprot:s1_g1709.t1